MTLALEVDSIDTTIRTVVPTLTCERYFAFLVVGPCYRHRPVERGGGVFPGPTTLRGPAIAHKYFKTGSRWLLSGLTYA